MAMLLLKSMRICSGLAALAGPLFAAEPNIRIPSKSLAQNANAPIEIASSDYLPPAPLAPVPSPNWAPGSVATDYAPAPSYHAGHMGAANYGTPGGYEARIGSPYHYYDPNGGQYVA